MNVIGNTIIFPHSVTVVFIYSVGGADPYKSLRILLDTGDIVL